MPNFAQLPPGVVVDGIYIHDGERSIKVMGVSTYDDAAIIEASKKGKIKVRIRKGESDIRRKYSGCVATSIVRKAIS